MFNFSTQENAVLTKISKAAALVQVDTYVVGGFVRDKLLQRPNKDIDIVCVGDGVELAKEVAKLFDPVPQVNVFQNFGTAQLKIKDFEIEFVGARKESYRGNSRKPDVLPGTLQDDQLRRDFTINAMAIALNKNNFGEFIDPFNGLEHLEQKKIVTPVAPDQTFSDDPLRMLRAIRFACQLQFTIDGTTLQSITKQAHRLSIISQERITDELNKIILSKKPSIGLDLLYTTGLLQKFFPEMVSLAGAEYIEGKGHKDNFYHTLQVLDNICKSTNDLWVRWAAILHDIGKPKTKRYEPGIGWTFHGHEAVGAKMTPKIFTRLKLPQHEAMKKVQKLVLMHLRPISLTQENITDSAIRRLLFESGEDFDDLMKLCEADITSKNAYKVNKYLANYQMVRQRCKEVEEKDHMRLWQPPISGSEIMDIFNLPQGRNVGIIKEAIKDAILDGVIQNNYNAAYQFMVEKAAELGYKPQHKAVNPITPS
jgi:poly(A) polymerase